MFVDGRGAQGRIYPTGSTGGTFQITDLTAGETYGVYVTSTDSSGNESVASDISTIEVKSILDGTSIPQLEADLATAKTDIVNLGGAVQAASDAASAANTKAIEAAGSALTANETATDAQTKATAATAQAANAKAYADSLVAQSENKIANPSFEFDFEGWENSGWTIDATPANANTGTKSAITNLTTTRTLTSAPWPINGGERYRFSMYYRGTSGSGSMGGGFRPQYSTNGGATWTEASASNVAYATTYTSVTADIIFPATAKMARLRLAWPPITGISIRIDNISAKDITLAQTAITNAATAQTAANTAQTAANNAQTAANTAQTAANNAASAAATAQGTANTAVSNAATAQTKADNAALAASDAATAASTAAGIANSKADVFIQPGAPNEANQKASTLWIDTTGGANTPKRWSGSAWVEVTDKAAKDAAAAAVNAKAAADAAQGTANAAQTLAGQAKTIAEAAQTTASSRNAIFHATTAPAGTGEKAGDIWYQWSTLSAGGKILLTWRWNGSNWVPLVMDETYLPQVNIGNGTYGLLEGQRIVAQSITTRELLVGNPSNLITDPNTTNLIVAGTGPGQGADSPFWKHWAVMTGSAAGWSTQATTGLPGNTIRHNVTSGAGDQRLAIRESIQVANGEWYYIGFKADIQGWAGGPPRVRLVWRTVTGGYIGQSGELSVTAGWSEQNLKIRVPTNNANIMKAQFEIIVPAGATAGTLYIGNLVWRPANTGSMIVDGSITAAQLNAENVAAGLGSFMTVEAKNIVAGTGNFDSAVVGKLKTAVLTANAVDAVVLKGDAIDGKVITGATYRTGASGARVEINGSALVGAADKGLTVYNSDNKPTARLGYNIPTGLEVRHPSVDRLIPISDAVFGTTTLSGGSSYGYYQNIGGSPGAAFVTTGSNRNNQTATDIPGTFTALTNKTQVQLYLEVVWGPAAPRGIAIMVHIATGGSLQGTPIYMYVAAKEFGVDFQTPVAVGSVTTTPGQTYRLHMNTTVKTVNSSLGDTHPYGTQIFRATGIVTPL